MVQVCLLIGFLYPNSPQALDCVYTDLYTMYNLSRSSGAFTITITDVDCIPQSTINHIVTEGIDDGIGQYHPGSSDDLEWHKVTTQQELFSCLSSLELSGVDRLMVYYSGHCHPGGMLELPDHTTLSMLNFRNRVLAEACASQVFFIFDCCHSDHLELPYRYNKQCNSFRLDNLDHPVTQVVMSITSSGKNQPSHARNTVSLFTKSLVDCIDKKIFNLTRLLNVIESQIYQDSPDELPEISIQASYPITPVMWTWLRNSKYDIYINDPTDSIAIIV